MTDSLKSHLNINTIKALVDLSWLTWPSVRVSRTTATTVTVTRNSVSPHAGQNQIIPPLHVYDFIELPS